jgi:hypothetical protein
VDEHESPLSAPGTDEDDTEGQAFKWQIIDDPKGGKQLRQGWTPDEPQSRRARTNTSTKGNPRSDR